MLRLCIVLFFLQCCSLRLTAQDSVLINLLVRRIALQQVDRDNQFFSKGNFPSYISNSANFRTTKKDNNVFFNALIHYTLSICYDFLSQQNRFNIDSVRRQSALLYPKFKNRKDRITYNFWRTDSAYVFPYTSWIHLIKKNTALPDDMDDTVLSLMAQNADTASAAAAHLVMQQYVNKQKGAKSIEKKYRQYEAYSVWYGKDFPPVFDVCVLSNVLSFVQQYHLQWTTADSAGLQVIIQAVKSGDYQTKPLLVSPYYGNTSVILYHLARLMSIKKIPQLEELKTSLITTAVQQFAAADNSLEKIILSTAIMKWGYVPPVLNLPQEDEFLKAVEQNDLPFFIGNIPSYFPSFYKRLFTQKNWLLFYHYCPAYNDVLLLEYLLLKQNL